MGMGPFLLSNAILVSFAGSVLSMVFSQALHSGSGAFAEWLEQPVKLRPEPQGELLA